MKKRRLAVYFHYDPAGQVDEPCRLSVASLHPHTEELWFVTNGKLTAVDRAWAVQSGGVLLERENVGYDAWAYRDALLAIGREKLQEYDELLLLNYTLAGPVCPLDAMFTAMDAQNDLGFWGLTRHYAMQSRRFGGKVPEHLQSHFIAVRRDLFSTDLFWNYWRQMPQPKSYEQAVLYHELRFTKVFGGAGYRWDTYVNTEDLAPVFVNPIMACPQQLLARRGLPYFKRRSFFTLYADELRRTDGGAARRLYDYLKSNTDYPVEGLLRSLLRSQPLSVLAKNLHWHYVLTERADSSQKIELEAEGLRLLCFPWPHTGDAVAEYYFKQSAEEAQMLLAQAAALFRQDSLLGAVGPSLPLWPGAQRVVAKQWQSAYPRLQAELPGLPMERDCPPPLPCCGWVLVRSAAYPDGIPDLETPENAWLLPLLAQRSGFICATFESTASAAARTDILQTYCTKAANPAEVARQLARLTKHRWKGEGND